MSKQIVDVPSREKLSSTEIGRVWNAVRDDFRWDGGLRDVYIANTKIEQWQTLIDLLRESRYCLSYQRDAESRPLPARIADIFADRGVTHLLSIDNDGIIVNCHFFTIEEIELDIDPREVQTQERFGSLLTLLREIAQRLVRDVTLTYENMESAIIFVVRG